MMFRNVTATAVPRTVPRAIRMYTEGPSGGAGATAQAPGWSKREKAQEDMYIIEHEREKLKKRAHHC